MGEVVKLFTGRTQPGKKLPKPEICKDCEEPVETARLQAIMAMNAGILLRPIRCLTCANIREKHLNREMSAARERDCIIIRG